MSVCSFERVLRRVGVVAVLNLLLVAVAAVPASARTVSLADDFEHPSSGWTFERSGDGNGEFGADSFWAHSGSGYALLVAQTGFSAIRRDVLPVASVTSCTASVWIDPVVFPANGHIRVNVEAINPRTWTYWTLKSVDYTGTGWRKVTTGTFRPTPGTPFVFRVALLSLDNGEFILADVDDFAVSCAIP